MRVTCVCVGVQKISSYKSCNYEHLKLQNILISVESE